MDGGPLFLSGSAARSIAGALAHKGAWLAAPPASFFVRDSEGPLLEGELERAGAWAAMLAARLEASVTGAIAGSHDV